MIREKMMTDLLLLIRAEHCESPGLQLTEPQAQRLWNLDTTTCKSELEALEAAGFLRRTPRGAYVKTGM